MKTYIKLFTKPTSAPNIFDGIPKTIVAFNNFSNIDVASFNIASIVDSTANIKINATISYNNIFNDVTPLNLPEKVKNGATVYKKEDTYPLKRNAIIIIKIEPTVSTN